MTDNDALNLKAIDALRLLFKENLPAFVDTFITKTEAQFEVLNTAITEHDLTTVTLILHSIKGGSGSLGAHSLHKLCQELELRAKSGDEIEDILNWPNQLKAEFELFTAAINRYLA